ncbi:hypothetical protein [Pseudomonas sp. BMS12]|uniref:hypothetical protein n=1 Tax=Pseudomonas sp. BMS12 TaxID=1796033 RepID=UPI000839F486|nr:hypothetical protein [Pseudomonas sp. BMS12]
MKDYETRALEILAACQARAGEARDAGIEEPFAVGSGAVLSGMLIKALEQIDRLEDDIKLLTEMLAELEGKQ